MAIEGPLRELGIHDVFQLLDLSRKTGALRVTSGFRDNEGTVYFDTGQVVYASIRSNPHPLGAMLVRSGRITEAELARVRSLQAELRDGRRLGQLLTDEGLISVRELERQLRLQIEAVVFELLSWREGFFSFVEQDIAELQVDAAVRISAESLLMEGARRMDEWSAISDWVSGTDVVLTMTDEGAPAVAGTSPASNGDRSASPLELKLEQWEVLAAVDGVRDLRAIATVLGRSELEVARSAAELVRLRVLETIRRPATVDSTGAGRAQAERAAMLLAENDVEGALAEARLGIAADPACVPARLSAARALERLGRRKESVEELRRAAQLDPGALDVQRTLGFAAARAGELDEAITSWRLYIHSAADSPRRDEVVYALEAATRLQELLDEHDWGD